MPEMGPSKTKDLRSCLRDNTADLHDRLDDRVRTLDLVDEGDYVAFLRFQYAARAPIEAWLDRRAPDLALPPMAPLIAQDLEAMNDGLPACGVFRCPAATGAIGIAWALAGSHLGNRALLTQLRKREAAERPIAFLADETMRASWQDLLPRLEAPTDRLECAQAVTAAHAVFDHFARALDQTIDGTERAAA